MCAWYAEKVGNPSIKEVLQREGTVGGGYRGSGFWQSATRDWVLSVNSFCPGFTQTSMTRCKGDHTADDAALFGARLALLPPDKIQTGKFFLWGSSSTTSNSNYVLISSKL
ncbi:hypothetical protein M0R45_019420 [Rubus argutus]|uniref:Uncharacterized protein n=1 Tax=Rubus argutus TaxID=59490 RepID=A0AAW1X651_RUBAR